MLNFVKLFFLLIIASNMNIEACTNIIVTKGASSNGSTMITYAADSYSLYGELYHWPAAIYPAGMLLEVFDWDSGKFLGKIPQVLRTYNVVGNMNEHQLVISETTFGGRPELVDSKGVIDYGSLIYITLQRAKTAREAIKIMTELVEKHGYYSSGESFSIGDPNEAWILEMVGKGGVEKGAVWVAVRIPDGYVSGHANMARITQFNQNDPENIVFSKDVISFARKMGYYNGSDKDFDFAEVYQPRSFSKVRFCDGRVWSFFSKINKGMEKYIDYIEGKSSERMPLYVKPENKLGLKDVMNLMRDHYEGTPLDMTKGVAAGSYGMPYRWRPLSFNYQGETYFGERPISTPQTAFSFVSQSRKDLPNEVGGVLWFGLDDTYMTVYTPLYTNMTTPPKNYKKGVGALGQFTWDSAFWVFNFVSNFAYPKYSIIIDDIKTEQNKIEGLFLSRQEEIEKTALAYYKESPNKSVEYLTKYSNDMAEYTHDTWKKFGEKLVVKYIDGVVKNEYFQPQNAGYPEDFKRKIVEENGAYLKMRVLPEEKEANFEDFKKQAETATNKNNYKEAVGLYKKALELKPEKAEIKTKIEKLNQIIEEIAKLHEKLK